MTRWIYSFGGGKALAPADAAATLGGKGAGLAQMTRLKLPVPPGFTISTALCRWFYAHGRTMPPGLERELAAALDGVERLTGRRFGDDARPLLLSVRSGARISMPGMMDTVLNVGLNDKTVQTLALAADARFAYDSYRRFIHLYSVLVLDMDTDMFEDMLDEALDSRGYENGAQMQAADWQDLCRRYKDFVQQEEGQPFVQEPQAQLAGAIRAVLASWMSARAVLYRNLHDIPEDWGTAVTVQAMVFGNMGETSASGVAFTRNPATGESGIAGEFLLNAQGEDVVSGIRTPRQLSKQARLAAGETRLSLEETMPAAFAALQEVATRLERHYRAVQDIEFTIEQGVLWLLQTRQAHCTAAASLKIAVDMAQSGRIDRDEAVLQVEGLELQRLLSPVVDPAAERAVITRGLPAAPGVATGGLVFSSAAAEAAAARGEAVILVRPETSPHDIHGLHAACGILTTRGGVSSHAAAVARSMGKPCVCGAGDIRIADDETGMTVAGQFYPRGARITIDGNNGEVMRGEVALIQPVLQPEFTTFMQWVDAACPDTMQKTAEGERPPVERLAAAQAALRKNRGKQCHNA